MISSRRTHIGHRRRLLVIPVLVAMVAASCGGDDDDDAEQSAEVTRGAADRHRGAHRGGDSIARSPTATTAPPRKRSRRSVGPVVETLPPETVPEPVKGGTLRYGLEADVDGLNPTTSALSSPGLMMAERGVRHAHRHHRRQSGRAVPGAVGRAGHRRLQVLDGEAAARTSRSTTARRSTPTRSSPTSRRSATTRWSGWRCKPFFPETERGPEDRRHDRAVQPARLQRLLPGDTGHRSSAWWRRRRGSPPRPADPTLNQQPVGTGPFKFDSRSQDSVTRFVRNDDWWNGEVYLDAVEFYPVPDTATRVDLMLGGELEALQTTDPDAIITLQDEGIPNVYDDSAAEQFAMINTAARAVRRHPRPPGARHGPPRGRTTST